MWRFTLALPECPTDEERSQHKWRKAPQLGIGYSLQRKYILGVTPCSPPLLARDSVVTRDNTPSYSRYLCCSWELFAALLSAELGSRMGHKQGGPSRMRAAARVRPEYQGTQLALNEKGDFSKGSLRREPVSLLRKGYIWGRCSCIFRW